MSGRVHRVLPLKGEEGWKDGKRQNLAETGSTFFHFNSRLHLENGLVLFSLFFLANVVAAVQEKKNFWLVAIERVSKRLILKIELFISHGIVALLL